MITHDKIVKAILEINSDAKFVVRGEVVEWLEGTTPISKADIEAKMVEVQAEYDANQYQRDRATAYPPIGDQLDMLWHTIDKDILLQKRYFDFYQTIKKVKVKYPKT